MRLLLVTLPCPPEALAGVLSLGLRAPCRVRPFDALLSAGWHGVFPLQGGRDTKRFTRETAPQLARELGLRGLSVLLSRGPLCRARGVDTVLYALRALSGELERLALRLHLAHEVQFLGHVADDRQPRWVQLWAERLLDALSARPKRPSSASHRSNDATLN